MTENQNFAGLIISASRRTDLPGFYPQWTVRKIIRKRKPIHSVFFWTKHPHSFLIHSILRELVQNHLKNPFLLLTITGLGGTRIEPNVPSADDLIKILPSVIEVFHGMAERIRWRFDPVLPNVSHDKIFSRIAPKIRQCGITECIISLPAMRSMKGRLIKIYNKYGIGVWNQDEARTTVENLLKVAHKYDISIYSCATDILNTWFPGEIKPASCINAEFARRFHPDGLKIEYQKDRAQRKSCTCTVSEDIGSYTLTPCTSGCLYCYSKAGGPNY